VVAPLPTPRRVGAARACQWPLWGHGERPTHRYCGAPSHGGASYCEAHCAAVFAPPLPLPGVPRDWSVVQEAA
jgi:hypothetical protein